MARGDLDLAIARMSFLKASERVVLAKALDRAEDLSVLSPADLERLVGRPLAARGWDPVTLLAAAAGDREACARRGISFVVYGDASYPPLLRETADPPAVLFFRGALSDPEKPLAAVVGTRSPSAEGARAAYEFGRDFGRSGVAVVSGLARGIDALAHRGNVDAGAPTVAVLGCGLDAVYPASNRDLARRILESGGALLSEYPPGTAPLKHHFPARNRIIAGLCRSLVVIEAPAKSGALISAEFAYEQGRDLYAASACLGSAAAAGCRALVSDGALVARNAFEVVSDWGLPTPRETAERPRLSARSFGLRAAEALEFEFQIGPDSPQAGRAALGVR